MASHSMDVEDGPVERVPFHLSIGEQRIWIDFHGIVEPTWAIQGKSISFFMDANNQLRVIEFRLSPNEMARWKELPRGAK